MPAGALQAVAWRALARRAPMQHALSPPALSLPAPSPPALSPHGGMLRAVTPPTMAPHALAAPALTPRAIGRAATLALYDELALSPKPGLVTLTDHGSHSDMDAATFMRSLFALRSYFPRIAALGQQGAAFDALQCCGIDAEARMLAATGGINTHRGAIFLLGLLCAAAGALAQAGQPLQPYAVRAMLQQRWGAALAARAQQAPAMPGGLVARRLGLRGAAHEAASGFPVLFDTAVPALADARARGLSPRLARLDTLFHVMAVLDDSNLALRGGLAGLRYAQAAAHDFLAAGGAAQPDAVQAAAAIGRDFVARRLSPGGAADTVAAACWLQRVSARVAHAPLHDTAPLMPWPTR